MTRTLIIIALTVLWRLNASPVLYAADEGILLTEEIQLKLADSFMDEHEYYRAVTELKKFIILFPSSSRTDTVLFKLGTAYYHGDEFEPAIKAFSSVTARYPQSNYSPQAGYYIGLCEWRLNRLDEALTDFMLVASRYPTSPDAPQSLQSASMVAFDQKDIVKSREIMGQLQASYPERRDAAKTEKALALLDDKQLLPRKSPAVAALLSALIPGAGHIYAGHYGDGMTSFFLNGLFIAGTVIAAQQENYAVAGVIGGIGLPFYLGNIYGAANAATKWNITIRKELRGEISVLLNSPF